jgi:hypothetical protein
MSRAERAAHPYPTTASVWADLLAAPRDEWHRPLGTRDQITNLRMWQERGWVELRRLPTRGRPVEARLTLNGRVWTRQWLGDDA